MPIKTRGERSRSILRSPVLRIAAVVGLVAGITVAVDPAAQAGPTTLYAASTPQAGADCLTPANACSLATALAIATAGTNVELVTTGNESNPSTFYSGGFSISTAGTSASAPVTIEPATSVTDPILDGGNSQTILNVGSMYLDINGVTVQDAGATGVDNNSGGIVSVTDSTFSDNVGVDGGAIDNGDLDGPEVFSTVVVTDSTFSNNRAVDGGALDNGERNLAVATVTDSTFVNNTASALGGTIADGNEGFGDLTLTDSTLSGSGGASGDISDFASSDNGSGNWTISGDIFAGGGCVDGLYGGLNDFGYDVGSDNSCLLDSAQDVVSPNLSSLLGPLASNGGPTETSALLAGNPAIGLVPNPTSGLCPVSADQRGVASPSGAACNAGAVQASVPAPPAVGSATAGSAEATVTFSPPADIGNSTITHYTVEAFNAAGNATGIVASGPGSPLTVTGLTNGDRYTFEVAAFNAAGEGPFSSASNPVISGAPLAHTIPGAMTLAGPAVTATKTAYVVAWQDTDRTTLAWTSAPATAGQSTYAWMPPQVISGVASSAAPALATFENKPYMAWKGAAKDSRIWFSSLTGNQWKAQTSIPGAVTSTSPALAAGKIGTTSYLVAAWKGEGTDTRLFAAYTTNGKTWTTIGQVPGNVVSDDAPALAISGSSVFLTWTGSGQQTIHESQATLGTFNWKAPIKLKGVGGTSTSPALASLHASAIIQSVWKAATGDDHIFANQFSSTTPGSGQKQVSVILTNTNPGLGSVPVGSPAAILLAWKAAANDQIWIAPLTGLSAG